MRERRHKLPLLIVWSDVIIAGIVSWVLGKALDYTYNYTKQRLRLKPAKSGFLLRC